LLLHSKVPQSSVPKSQVPVNVSGGAGMPSGAKLGLFGSMPVSMTPTTMPSPALSGPPN